MPRHQSSQVTQAFPKRLKSPKRLEDLQVDNITRRYSRRIDLCHYRRIVKALLDVLDIQIRDIAAAKCHCTKKIKSLKNIFISSLFCFLLL